MYLVKVGERRVINLRFLVDSEVLIPPGDTRPRMTRITLAEGREIDLTGPDADDWHRGLTQAMVTLGFTEIDQPRASGGRRVDPKRRRGPHATSE